MLLIQIIKGVCSHSNSQSVNCSSHGDCADHENHEYFVTLKLIHARSQRPQSCNACSRYLKTDTTLEIFMSKPPDFSLRAYPTSD